MLIRKGKRTLRSIVMNELNFQDHSTVRIYCRLSARKRIRVRAIRT